MYTNMEISIAAEKLFSIGFLPVTNAFLIGVVVSTLLIFFITRVAKNPTLVPRGLQNVLEIIFEALLDFVHPQFVFEVGAYACSRYPPLSVSSRRAFAGSGSIFWRRR